MREVKDRVGETVGRLTIIDRGEDKFSKHGTRRVYWVCQCECGNIKTIRADQLDGKHTMSCGCLQREKSAEYNSTRERKVIYGDSRERIHNIWYLIKYRCEDETSPTYRHYGGRGIKMCQEWSDGIDGYWKFKTWSLDNGYADNLTIDRIDNDGCYSPENCRWVDHSVQGNNKRNNIILEYDGREQTLSQWARELGVPMKSLHRRIRGLGWDVERAFTQPYRNQNRKDIAQT